MGGLQPWAILGWRPTSVQLFKFPPPLRRMFEGIAKLPPLEILVPITPGAWCASAPLWHNPLLESMILGLPLAERFPELISLPINTLWQLEFVLRQLTLPTPLLPWIAVMPGTMRASLLTKLTRLHAVLPIVWTQAVVQVLAVAPALDAFWDVAWATLGWRVDSKDVLLEELTVRLGTALQLQATLLPRGAKHHAFQQLALSPGSGAVPPAANPAQQQPSMPVLLQALWRLRCGNRIKEPYRRLVLNAIPTAERRHATAEVCWCGVSNADRAHHFWHCPVAQRVVVEVDSELIAFEARRGRQYIPIAMADVWLARPPRGVQLWIWRLVCLAAIAAMDMGRARACQLQLGEPQHSSAEIVRKAGQAAMARLWELLAEAASGRKLPAGRTPQAAQPFIHWDAAEEIWMPKRAAGH